MPNVPAIDSTAALPDLADCAREQIHIPSSIQPHGVLFVLGETDFRIRQMSANAHEMLGLGPREQDPTSLEEVLDVDVCAIVLRRLQSAPLGARAVSLGPVSLNRAGGTKHFHAIGHRIDAGIVLELEEIEAPDGIVSMPQVAPALDDFTLQAESSETIEDLSALVSVEVRKLTGFDRVLVYKFDEDWNGIVVGQDGNGRLPSLLHHRFPASDIPAQARELYRINRMRIIPDAHYRPVPIKPATNPATGRVLDMTFSTLRSVSPVHVEYMQNMETLSSMSVSILREGRLWGLISCHHHEARHLTFPVRVACELMARAFSLRLSAIEQAADLKRSVEVTSTYAELIAIMTDHGDFAVTLSEAPELLLAFANAKGAAVISGEECRLYGATPTETQVRQLANWLFSHVQKDVYSTDSLSREYEPAKAYEDVAAGVLAISVSKIGAGAVIWFRPEVVQTLTWSGDPTKHVTTTDDGVPRIRPRRSFASYLQTVRERSLPWLESEVWAAADLRNTIVGTVLRKAEQMAELTSELTRSNKELEAFSYSVSHDLRAPLRHIVGYAEILKETGADCLNDEQNRYLNTIIESSEYAGKLVDKLLNFSRLGRSKLERIPVDMNTLVQETIRDVMIDAAGRKITWTVDRLPTVNADLMMLRMAVRDLLSNAVKYTRSREQAVIEFGCRHERGEYVFSVKDNGVGFDMAYADKLFGVFQRLHKWEDFEGTGIGLANVRRVLERHGGRTWAEGKENVGATFYFTLPAGDQ
jgi:light-regulated signal transduction histidine kinase (bacteriophytochrome)